MLKDAIEKFSDEVIIQPAKMDIYDLPRMTTVHDISLKFRKEGFKEYHKGLSTKNYYKTKDKESQEIKEKAILLQQKQNLEELVGHHLCTIQEIIDSYEKCIVKDIPIKIVLLGDELIAIASLDETKFILAEDISKPVISKETFIHHIENILSTRADNILKEFSSDISAFRAFLSNHSQHISLLTLDKQRNLKSTLLDLSGLLK